MKLLCTLLLLLAGNHGLYPCSIFRYTRDGRTYFCGNEDWTIRAAAIQTFKATGKDYGYVLIGWKGLLPHWVQAGINSQGLCFDWAAVPPQPYLRDETKTDLSPDFTIEVLKSCATVDEAVEYIRKHNIPHLAEEHIMFADKRGTSAVVEFNHGHLRVVYNRSPAQFMTNFHLTDPSLGWYPCERYSKMEAFFREDGNKEARLVKLLDGVHQEGKYPTVYSYVFDLYRMRITVFYDHDFAARQRFSVDDLIEEESILDIAS